MDDAGGRLIARAGELDRLALAWSAASAGTSRTVIVAGEAGIGKSSLVRAFAQRVRSSGGRVLSGACLPLGTGDLPYGPFVEAFRGMLKTLQPGEIPAAFGHDRAEMARLLPELRPRSGDSALATADPIDPAHGPDDRYIQVRLFEVVLGVIDRLARTAPVALLLEDVQWADASTLDLLEFLVRSLRDEPVLLIVTLRTDDLPPGSAVPVHLGDTALRRSLLVLIDQLDLAAAENAAALIDELGGVVGATL